LAKAQRNRILFTVRLKPLVFAIFNRQLKLTAIANGFTAIHKGFTVIAKGFTGKDKSRRSSFVIRNC